MEKIKRFFNNKNVQWIISTILFLISLFIFTFVLCNIYKSKNKEMNPKTDENAETTSIIISGTTYINEDGDTIATIIDEETGEEITVIIDSDTGEVLTTTTNPETGEVVTKVITTKPTTTKPARKVDATFNNVEEMKNSNLDEGKEVLTKGYYNANDGGTAYYKIEKTNSSHSIKLNNNLYAKLLPENKTINVKQFGAYGDLEHDDSDYIQNAFNALDNNEITTIYFPEGSYKTTKTIIMKSGNYIGHEKSKIVITDFNSNKEYAFGNINKRDDVSTIHIDSLNFEVNVQAKYTTYVLRFGHTKNSSIKNTHCRTASTNTSGVTFIDLYNANNYFDILSSSSYIITDDNRLNTHIQIRDAYGSTNTNINVNGFVGEKNGKDESIWLDGWHGTIKNVDIANCTFKVSGNNINDIYLGTTYSHATLDNINFHDSTIIRDNYKYKIVSIAAGGDTRTDDISGKNLNIKVYNNTIKINSISSTGLNNGSTIIQLGQRDISGENNIKNVVENNTIIAENANIGTVIKDVSSNHFAIAKNNTIKVNSFNNTAGPFAGVYYGLKEVTGGTISKLDGSKVNANYIMRNVDYIHDMDVNINNEFMNYYNTNMNILVKNCNVTSSSKTPINFNVQSTSVPTLRIEDSKFTSGTQNRFGVWYNDLSSSQSTNLSVTVYTKNTTYVGNKVSGTINVIEE